MLSERAAPLIYSEFYCRPINKATSRIKLTFVLRLEFAESLIFHNKSSILLRQSALDIALVSDLSTLI